MGIDVSMLMDRRTTNIAKAQVGFIDLFIKPSYYALNRLLLNIGECIEHLESNQRQWGSLTESFDPVELMKMSSRSQAA